MRRLPERPLLLDKTQNKLAAKTKLIVGAPDPIATANTIYTSSRPTAWFSPVTAVLKQMSGHGQRCMFCSGSECSEVEHFRPKAHFPELAMTWSNLLWICGRCNNIKGNKFPPQYGAGCLLINPIEEDVWNFFFIDEFGNLTPKWQPEANDLDPRAVSTREVVQLDREVLQLSRQARMRNLIHLIRAAHRDFTEGQIGLQELIERIEEWKREPFQPDVADYFLNGPGKTEEPFSSILALVSQ